MSSRDPPLLIYKLSGGATVADTLWLMKDHQDSQYALVHFSPILISHFIKYYVQPIIGLTTLLVLLQQSRPKQIYTQELP